jgi:ferredoxin
MAEPLDLTPPEARTRQFEELGDELVIIGAPVYGGRIPSEAVRRLRRLKANETPAAIVVVYGNRAYEDALLELRDLVTQLGCRPVAAGAFIGEHSYSTQTTPIAYGRPDAQDLAQALEFGELVQRQMGESSTIYQTTPLRVPGSFPYREWTPPSGIAPITDEALCTRCETCAHICPIAAIAIGDVVATDLTSCILCSACVKSCPTGARAWEHARIARSREWLSTNCRERKAPEMYL